MNRKDLFYEKVANLCEAKGDRSALLDDNKYETVLSETKEACTLWDSKKLLITKHYCRLKRYEM